MPWFPQHADKNMNIYLPPLGKLQELSENWPRFNTASCTLKTDKSASFVADLEQSPTKSY